MAGLENLLAGKTLVKRYRIEEVIGLGGFAAVYRAEDLRLGRPVAVKVITLAPPDPAVRERVRERFEREARAAASLPHHPNVVTVHDFGTDPELGVDFLVMELLKGENLAQLFKREGRPPTDIALQVLREAAEGIAVGHAAGIIHRDVKPGNIFLAEAHDDDPFRVVVLDFGIARIATDDSELTRTLAGENPLTAAYASPEQIRGEHALTPAADVFSLGAVGYQLLTGTKPFTEGEGRRLRGRDPIRPVHEASPAVSPAVEAVIERAMAEDPDARYADAAAFGEALDTAMAEDDRTVIAPLAAAGAAAALADDATVLQPTPAPAATPAARRYPDYVAGPPRGPQAPRVAPVSGRRSKLPAVLGGLLVLALIAAAAVLATSRHGGSSRGAQARPAPADTTTRAETTHPAASAAPADTLGSAASTSAPPSASGSGAASGGAGGSASSGSGSATAPSAPPLVRTPGIAPEPTAEPSSPVHVPAVTPPAPAPAPAPAPPSAPPASAPAPRPRPRPTPPPAPEPAPQPAPEPAPAPAPPPPPPAPSTPPPRDTILIPTPNAPPPAPPASPR